MQPTDRSSRLGSRSVNRSRLTCPRLALALSLLVLTALDAPSAVAQEPEASATSSEERRQRMEERRRQRAEAAAEARARRDDPDYIKEKAWWNDPENIEAFALTAAQRNIADEALATFLVKREKTGNATRDAQAAFYEALAAGSADLQLKKEQMISAVAAATAAGAELRITVIGSLSADQRAELGREKPRLLRGDWATPRSRRSSRPLQRRRDSEPNG